MVATNATKSFGAPAADCTYSANPMAFDEAKERGLERLALVGMSCQTSVAPVMWHRKIGKVSKPFKLNIGLLCSKSISSDALFDELFEVKYGLKRENIAKMNIKGVFQVWTKDGGYHEINLKECHAWTREGCNHCPDRGRARRHLHRRDRQRDRLDPHHRANRTRSCRHRRHGEGRSDRDPTRRR